MATKTQLVNMMGEVLPERKILSDLLWFIYLYHNRTIVLYSSLGTLNSFSICGI